MQKLLLTIPMKSKMHKHLMTSLFLVIIFILKTTSAKEGVIKSSVEDDKSYNENELEYDFYDNEDVDVNSGEVQGNYSYSEQDYENENENNESELDFIPELISQPQTMIAKSGETIELPCKASDSAAFVRIWKKGDTMLFTGTVQISREASLARYKLDPMDNTTLVIHDITPDDAGEYSCRIMVRERDIISLTHRISISTTFNVQPVPPDGLITLSEGENASLSCFVSGADVSEDNQMLRWTREGVAFQNGNYSIESVKYDLVNASKNDSGFYFCTATSEKGETRSAEIEVRVQFSPTVVSIQKSIIRSGRGILVEFSCLINGEPVPKIVWYKGDEVVTLSSRVVTQRAGNRHLLVIHRVRSDDSATYMCYATNEFGSSQKTIAFDDQDLINSNLDIEKGTKVRNVDLSELTKKYQQLTSLIAEDKESLNTFQKQCEGDIRSLRNLTLDVMNSVKAGTLGNLQSNSDSTSSLDLSLFSDIERLSQEFRQFQSTIGQNVRDLTTFKTTSTDELERLWENVSELQELTNITSRSIEEIYDKDILALQNFRTTVQHEINKLRNEFETFLQSSASSIPTRSSALDYSSISDPNTIQGKVELMEVEFARMKNSVSKLEESQTINREEMMRVFSDVDGLKKQQQAMEIEQLKIQRNIQKIETQDLADISNKMKSIDRKFDEFDEFQESTKKALAEGNNDGDEKYSLIVAEMQKLKNQIFYLQQSVIHMRGGSNPGVPLVSSVPRISISKEELASTIQDLVEEKLARLSKEISSCSSKESVEQLSQSMSERHAQMSGELQQVNDKLALVQEVSKSVETGIQDTNSRVTRNGRRIENLEVASRKYNLLINGLPAERRLERHAHLEKVVTDFFKNILNLEEVPFDEAERIAEPVGPGEGEAANSSKPVRVKFPNVRTKINVLQASRDPAIGKVLRENGISLMEDFTPAVKYRRRRLAAFARNRARAKRLKWALKYDELFFNGKVFIFSDQLNRVVPKPTSGKAKRNSSRPNE